MYYPDQIEKWAHSAWKRLGLEPPANVRAVADFLSIGVVKETLAPGVYGIYCRHEDGKARAFIERALPWQEQRRVLAHEIAHHLFSKHRLGVIEIQYALWNRHDELERACDAFAKHLLMPAEHVRAEAERLGRIGRMVRVAALASKFDVDRDVMRSRLVEMEILNGKGRHSTGRVI